MWASWLGLVSARDRQSAAAITAQCSQLDWFLSSHLPIIITISHISRLDQTTMAAYFGSNPSQRASSSSAAGGRNTHRPALQPVLFCGPGTNLYPLCEAPSLSPSGQPQAALPKALLPVANRPLISYPLQWLLSAGLRNAIILAPTSSHSQISAALRSLHLHLPPGAPASATTSAGAPNVFVGDAASVNAPSSGARDAAMRVELLPLGPDAEEAVKEDDAEEGFEGVPVLGTADLLRWLAREGKLEVRPLLSSELLSES